MERYTRFLLKQRVQVIILFVAAAAVCAVLSGLVGVNYKFADYLPEEAASTRAIEVMEEAASSDRPFRTCGCWSMMSAYPKRWNIRIG